MTDPIQQAPPLQFDVAVDSAAPVARSGIVCASCQRPVVAEYYALGNRSYCDVCKANVEAKLAAAQSPAAFGRALGVGLVAALAGAAVYFATAAFLGLEIGLVAILIGWMVGTAIRKIVPMGGRRYQFLAAALTYVAVGVAYLGIALYGAGRTGDVPFAGGLILVFAMPAIAAFTAFPSGLISGFIIGLGMVQAWRMTGAAKIRFDGPLRIAPRVSSL